MISDFVALMSGCVGVFGLSDPRAFGITVLGGICLAALCWYLCTIYTRLWNKRYTVTVLHHIFCGMASFFTLLFVILFASLNYTEQAALKLIDSWQNQLNNDAAWHESTYAEAYQKVRDLGIEDFANDPPPGTNGSIIPVRHTESRDAVAAVYANEAYNNFESTYPFLSRMAGTQNELPREAIIEDIKSWSFEEKGNYPLAEGISIAANQVEAGLAPQLSGLASRTRWTLVLLFLAIQAFAFGSIGWSAYRDIKVRM